jgi:hypothetical protein
MTYLDKLQVFQIKTIAKLVLSVIDSFSFLLLTAEIHTIHQKEFYSAEI